MNHFRNALHSAVLASLVGISACNKAPSPPDTSGLTAKLSSASEVPPATGDGSGTVEAKLNPQTNELSYTVTYANLSGAPTAGHFHGPASKGENAGVAVPISGDLASPITGSVTLTAPQVTELMAGKWYVNLHTAANPDGEIRGQVSTQ
jgi:CHRD domain